MSVRWPTGLTSAQNVYNRSTTVEEKVEWQLITNLPQTTELVFTFGLVSIFEESGARSCVEVIVTVPRKSVRATIRLGTFH